ncbi:inactive ubiquitin carboxyl-terminal hydrolase MINDY-4B [Falco biarmicus]|uniref:inactive ubiquitin carboxyl-terminal hydrolase MINDY-4B n=1 Tax=Falco biarmicus TaxID=345155 RepID=UPI0024BCD58E|nr:inactive ubiquitin carboxyl-terminal hydrolase MINDY-4B [Falco biarmicus]
MGFGCWHGSGGSCSLSSPSTHIPWHHLEHRWQQMGDHEAERTMPQTELEEITSRISDLNKWREIFSFHGERNPAHPSPPRQGLRKLLFGNLFHLFSCEWEKAYFRFHEPYSDLAYALEAEKWGPRAILMAVQAHIIKYLLFVRNTEYTHLERLCRINRREQGEALAAALADTLWAAGEGGRAVICLVTAAIHVMPSRGYKADNFTERIQLFEFSEKAAAQEFIFDHINCFKDEGSHGVILFLYSLLFSRTLERVQEDLDCTATPLLKFGFGNITCTQAMLSLLLTGRTQWRRGPVGYLHWDRAQAQRQVSAGFRANSCAQRRAVPLSQVCPRLRTPRLPIWLCSVSGRYSVLFGTDSQLLSDWKMERVFHLYFYSGQQEQRKTARLTIGTLHAYRGRRGGVAVTHRWCTALPCTLIHITGKRTKAKTQAAQGRGVRPWRWQSGPSGQAQQSTGMGQTPSFEESNGTDPSF